MLWPVKSTPPKGLWNLLWELGACIQAQLVVIPYAEVSKDVECHFRQRLADTCVEFDPTTMVQQILQRLRRAFYRLSTMLVREVLRFH
jgi:hypothetical protein